MLFYDLRKFDVRNVWDLSVRPFFVSNCQAFENTLMQRWLTELAHSTDHTPTCQIPPLSVQQSDDSLSPEFAEPTTPTASMDLVSPEDVALKLKEKNITIAVKTLKNTRTEKWGKPDGREGNGHMFDWNRIQPIVEEQFGVKFDD